MGWLRRTSLPFPRIFHRIGHVVPITHYVVSASSSVSGSFTSLIPAPAHLSKFLSSLYLLLLKYYDSSTTMHERSCERFTWALLKVLLYHLYDVKATRDATETGRSIWSSHPCRHWYRDLTRSFVIDMFHVDVFVRASAVGQSTCN